MKVQADIKLIKSCKQENLIPTFANIKLSLKYNNNKLKKRIARIVMETQIQNKHREKKSFKKEIRQKFILLKSTLVIVLKRNKLQYCNVIIKNQKNLESDKINIYLINKTIFKAVLFIIFHRILCRKLK